MTARLTAIQNLVRTRVARDLLAAYDTREPLEPLTATYEGMTLEDAYAIQLLQIEERLASGRTVRGHKVGLTSAALRAIRHDGALGAG